MKLPKIKIEYFFILVIFFSLYVKFYFVPVADPNNYPFIVSVDTWQWLTQGLYYIGEHEKNYYRTPILSFFYAILYLLKAEKFIGFIPQIFFSLLVFSVFFITRKIFGFFEGLVTALLLIFNSTLFAHSYYINSDMICFGLTALSIALVLVNKSYFTIFAWITVALTLLAQYAFPSFLLFIITLFLINGKKAINIYNLIGGGLFIIIMSFYFIFIAEKNLFGGGGIKFVGLSQFYGYLFTTISIIKPFSLFFIFIYLIDLIKKKSISSTKDLILLFWVISFFVFFAFFIEFGVNWRYVNYYSPALLVMTSIGICKLFNKINNFSKILLLTIFLLYQNLSISGDMFWPQVSERMVLTNSLFLKNDLSFEKGEIKSIFIYCNQNNQVDVLRKLANKNFEPKISSLLAQIVNNDLKNNRCFAFLPDRPKLSTKIEFLSGRKLCDDVYKNLPDLIINVPISPDNDLIKTYLLKNGYSLHKEFGPFAVFRK